MSFKFFASVGQGLVQSLAQRQMMNTPQRRGLGGKGCTPCAANARVQAAKAQVAAMRGNGRK